MIEQKEEYLYIQCIDKLCKVNLTKLSASSSSSNSNDDDDDTLSSQIFQVVVDFIKEDLPIQMGHLLVEKKEKEKEKGSNKTTELYFIGGEKLIKGKSVLNFKTSSRAVDYDYGLHGHNVNVFAYRPGSTTTTTGSRVSIVPLGEEEGSTSIPKMQAPKTDSVVVTFENKTYVLARVKYWPKNKSFLYPTFEAYDHLHNSWKALAEPPHPNISPISAHFFFNRTLYIKSIKGFIFYNVDTGSWGSSSHHSLHITPPDHSWTPGQPEPPFLSSPTGHVVEFDDSLIAYATNAKLMAWSFDPMEKHSYNTPRVLEELKELYEDQSWHCTKGCVFHLGDGKMCFLLYGHKGAQLGLLLSTFQFSSSPGESFVLTNHTFKSEHLPFHISFIRDAFIMFLLFHFLAYLRHKY